MSNEAEVVELEISRSSEALLDSVKAYRTDINYCMDRIERINLKSTSSENIEKYSKLEHHIERATQVMKHLLAEHRKLLEQVSEIK